MSKKLMAAFAGYAFFAILAWLTLERELRWSVWLVMAALAFKSWVAEKRQS